MFPIRPNCRTKNNKPCANPFKLSFRDLVEMMVERGISLVHTTIMRWIQRYVPEFEKRWNRFACRAGASWRVDEPYVKIKGHWTYLYRAGDCLKPRGQAAIAVRWHLGMRI
jgi:transposase-like protein